MNQELKMLLRYREMFFSTVSKELRARYKGSVLGFLWTFVNPLLQLAVYSLAFKYIMRISIPGINYTVYLFVGLTVWACLSNSLIMGSTVIVANGNLVKKIYFPRSILPLASVTGNVINMLLVFCIVLPIVWVFGYAPNAWYVFLPALVCIQWLMNLGFAFLLAAAYVYFRDLEHILNVLLMAWMYMTPIIYHESLLPSGFFHILKLNPMFPVVTSYQRILLFNQGPDMTGLAYALVFSLFMLLLGYSAFMTLQRRFAEEL